MDHTIDIIAAVLDPSGVPNHSDEIFELAKKIAVALRVELPQGLPRSMNAEPDGSVVGYMDITDFEYELGAASDGSKVYPDLESIKRECKACIDECGIVKVKVVPLEVILPPVPYHMRG
jgi:hypothetical protein